MQLFHLVTQIIHIIMHLNRMFPCSPSKAESDVLKPGLVIDDPSLLYPSAGSSLTSTVVAAIRRVEDTNEAAAQRIPGTALKVLEASSIPCHGVVHPLPGRSISCRSRPSFCWRHPSFFGVVHPFLVLSILCWRHPSFAGVIHPLLASSIIFWSLPSFAGVVHPLLASSILC